MGVMGPSTSSALLKTPKEPGSLSHTKRARNGYSVCAMTNWSSWDAWKTPSPPHQEGTLASQVHVDGSNTACVCVCVVYIQNLPFEIKIEEV